MERLRALSPWTLLAASLAAALYLKLAWVGEDAYIVFRSVEQLFAGHGPVWNPHERVQVFTSPLWFGLLALGRCCGGDLFGIALGLGALAWAGTLLALRRLAGSPGRFLLLVLGLAGANAVLDYTASGLESGLLYLLLALTVLAERRSRLPGPRGGAALTGLALVVGLVLVTRLDHVFLVGPPFAAALWRQRPLAGRRLAGLLALAFGPLAAWSVFATIWYGFPLPNTAYAKLDTGISAFVLVRQGVRYVLHTAGWDALVVAGLGGFVWWARRERGEWPWLVAVLLQLAYVVRVGGDFMQGRFLAGIFLVAAAVAIAARGADLVRRRALWSGLILYVGLFPWTPVNKPVHGGSSLIRLGIADERAVYADALSVWRWAAARRAQRPFPDLVWREEGEALRGGPGLPVVAPNIGVLGWAAGPDPIIIDPLALSDPFLARLPCDPAWRIGHFPRPVPPAYLASLAAGAPVVLDDPDRQALARDIALITRGDDLFAAERWRAILRRNP